MSAATAPFVTELRAGKRTIDLSHKGAASITIRVEMAEVWDVVRIVASPDTRVADVKAAAIGAMAPEAGALDEFMMKLRGWEVLDETATLSDAGARDGSIFLVTYRRRRPVR